jgi:chromosome segregation ATPase
MNGIKLFMSLNPLRGASRRKPETPMSDVHEQLYYAKEDARNLRGDLTEMGKENIVLGDKVEELTNETIEKTKTILCLQEAVAKHVDRVNELREQITIERNHIVKRDAIIREACRERDDARHDLAYAKQMIADLQIENAALRSELANATGQMKGGEA